MITPGMVCIKLAGRDAGKKCVVLKVDGDRAEVLGVRKNRLVNLKHLIPTEEKVDSKISREELLKKFGYKIGKGNYKKSTKKGKEKKV